MVAAPERFDMLRAMATTDPSSTDAALRAPAVTARRRRSQSPELRAARQAWGKQWGAILSTAALNVRMEDSCK